jgi:hypothetical protein
MVRKAADLYGLPLEEFTKARDELAKELRGAGRKEAADEVKALRKPTVSAWTVNQLARRRPQELRGLVKAGEELRKAQRAAVGGRGPGALRDASRSHRDRLDELTSAARHEFGAEGATLQRVAQTLRAASVDKEASKALLAGTLTGDVEQSGFGPVLSAVPASALRARPKPKAKPKPAPKPKPPPKPKPDPNVARRKKLQEQLDRARERVRELEARLDELGG